MSSNTKQTSTDQYYLHHNPVVTFSRQQQLLPDTPPRLPT